MSKLHYKHKRIRDTALWIGKVLGNLGKYMLGLLKQHLKSRVVNQEKTSHSKIKCLYLILFLKPKII